MYETKKTVIGNCKYHNLSSLPTLDTKHLLAILAMLLFQMSFTSQLVAQPYYGTGLPYFNTLNGSAPTGVTIGGNAATTTADGVQLTQQVNSQGGFFYLTNTNLQTANGLHVEFEYSASNNTTGADGISMILYGGTAASNFNIGATGNGLGYTYNRISPNSSTGGTQGVANGFLALGLDEFGNFKKVFNQGNPPIYREGIINSSSGWRNYSDNVTLRGPGNPNAESGSIAAWYSGYPILYSVITNPTASTGDYGASLNTSDGSYSYQNTNQLTNSFTIATATKSWDPTNPDYRKAFIDIVPVSSSNYKIIVKIQHGSTTDVVVNGYLLPTNNITAIDNSSTGTVSGTSNVIPSTLPSTLYIAFAGSTGGFNNAHYIKNLVLNTPYIAGVKSDTFNICNNTAAPYTVPNVINNDSAYTGLLSTPTASVNNIDKTTFVFSNDSTTVNLTNTVTASTVTATNSYGVWTFNIATGNVTLVPTTGNTSGGTIYYSIKGNSTPYKNEAYRAIGRAIRIINRNSSITSTSLPNATTSQAYNAQVLPAGAGFSYIASGLPSPVTMSSTGLISGVWPSSGVYPVTITLTNAYGCTAQKLITITASSALPVTYLQQLEGKVVTNGINLTWVTSIEANNKMFDIQRSANGTEWETIGSLNSYFPNGSGNGHSYSFIDKTPLNGNNMYRLHQIDNDGNYKFSNITLVNFSNTNGSATYIAPNPTLDQLNVYNIPANATLYIINATGQVLKVVTTINLNQTVDVSNLASGIYLLHVVSQNNKVSNTVKFFKK